MIQTLKENCVSPDTLVEFLVNDKAANMVKAGRLLELLDLLCQLHLLQVG